MHPFIALLKNNSTIAMLNKSKIFAGIVMILLNISSKYVHIKLTPAQELYLRKYITRELFIFATCWLGTRDIYVALSITLLFFVVSTYIFHEESGLLPKQEGMELPVRQEEIDAAVNVLRRAKQQTEKTVQNELLNQYNFNLM
jgi:hypothetical protein